MGFIFATHKYAIFLACSFSTFVKEYKGKIIMLKKVSVIGYFHKYSMWNISLRRHLIDCEKLCCLTGKMEGAQMLTQVHKDLKLERTITLRTGNERHEWCV